MTSIAQTPPSEAAISSSPSLLDSQTWEALYPQQFRKMVGYVVRQLGCDEMTAEDVVQDAVIRMWEHREDYPTPEHVPSLFTAFVRSQIRYHRSVQRKRQQEFAMTLVSLEQSADVAQVAAVDGSAEAVRTPEMQRALETFAGLPDAQQDLLRLWWYKGSGPRWSGSCCRTKEQRRFSWERRCRYRESCYSNCAIKRKGGSVQSVNSMASMNICVGCVKPVTSASATTTDGSRGPA